MSTKTKTANASTTGSDGKTVTFIAEISQKELDIGKCSAASKKQKERENKGVWVSIPGDKQKTKIFVSKGVSIDDAINRYLYKRRHIKL